MAIFSDRGSTPLISTNLENLRKQKSRRGFPCGKPTGFRLIVKDGYESTPSFSYFVRMFCFQEALDVV